MKKPYKSVRNYFDYPEATCSAYAKKSSKILHVLVMDRERRDAGKANSGEHASCVTAEFKCVLP